MNIQKIVKVSLIALIISSTSMAGSAYALKEVKTTTEITALTVPTKFVNVAGTKIAYRRLGKKTGVPIVLLQHFMGNLDNWDPLVIDGLAKDREVIIFDNRGIGASEGEVPVTYQAMADDAVAFIDALGLKRVDIFGFSMGGGIAQLITIQHPDLVRKVIIVGIAPRNGEGMQSLSPEAQAVFSKKRAVADELWLDVLFSQTETSQAAAHRFLERIRSRKIDRDAPVTSAAAGNQLTAIGEWGQPKVAGEERYAYLKELKQPALIVNGNHDIIVPTINSYILFQHIPNATLILFPDSSHGSFDQYPEEFVTDANNFLNK